MTFYLFGTPDEKLRLKNYASSSKGGKSTIRIEIETSDPYELGFALLKLGEVQKGQKPPPPPKPARHAKAPKMLALPSPQLALPKPEDDR
jgi:hypothetical protein